MSPKPPSRSVATRTDPQTESGARSARPAARQGGSEPIGGPEGSKPSAPAPGLHLVATPIGNLKDITLRALEVLAGADVLACEDTRVTRKLLAAHGIERPLLAYHEHNAGEMRPRLLAALAEGRSVALCSDAGTPLISDPGYKLVRAAVEAGHRVSPLPGASAPLAALVVSGLPSDRFYFGGFLPPKTAARRRALQALAGLEASLLFLESARRLPAALADLAAVLGPREAAVGRELTKLFEEIRRGSLAALAAAFAESGPPKGELVIVVGPPPAAPETAAEDLDAALRAALAEASLRDAVERVTAETGLPRRRVYQRALALSDGSPEHGTAEP